VTVRSATVEVGVVPPPPPPQFEVQTGVVMTTGTEEDVLGLGLLLEAFSPTIAVFVIVVPAVPAFAVAAMSNVAVELAERSPIVQVPVLEA
jgi:hypothetical protein